MQLTDINRTFVVNLPERIDRKYQAYEELTLKHGIGFETFPAIKKEDGAKGLKETMKELFTMCFRLGYDTALIFEDDAVLIDNAKNKLELCISELPADYHLLYLGCNILSKPAKINDNLLQIYGAYATHAIIYSKRAMELILEALNTDTHYAYDQILLTAIQKLGKSYCTYPMIANQRKGQSDIFVYDPKLYKGMSRYYSVEDNVIDWGLMMEDRFNAMTQNIM